MTVDDKKNQTIRQSLTKKRAEQFVNGGPVDAVIIGSGLSGLTTAALLSRAGWRVCVLEQHDVLGGTTHTFVEEGRFEFGTGLHYTGSAMARSKLLDCITDGKLQWAEMDPDYDHAELVDAPLGKEGGTEAVYMIKGFKALRAKLCAQFPKEEEAIKKYMSKIIKFQNVAGFLMLLKILPYSMLSFVGPMLAKWYGDLAQQTTYDVMKECGLSDTTIGMLAYNYGDYGTTPKKAPFFVQALHVAHWFKGAYFPVGGPEEIAINILTTIEKSGGTAFVNATVDKIVVGKNGSVEGVLLDKGMTIPCTNVVSSVGSYNTFVNLLDESMPLPPQIKANREALISSDLPLGTTMVSLFLGMEGTVESLQIPKHNKWIFPSWDHDENIRKQDEGGVDTPFSVVYMSFSCAKDPHWARKYPNTCVAEILAPVNYKMFEEYEKTKIKKRGDDYTALKEILIEKMMDVVYRRMPQIEGKVVYTNLGSPLTNNYYYNTVRGEVYALDHNMERFSTVNQRDVLRPKTAIKGLYVTGQDVFMAGVYTALLSGPLTLCTMSYTAMLKNVDILFRGIPAVYGEPKKDCSPELPTFVKIVLAVLFAIALKLLLQVI
eukprot:CFRG0949T1